MYKPLIFAIVLVYSHLPVSAQLSTDRAVVRKYQRDTLDFTSFPEAYVLDSIKPVKGISSWELNTSLSSVEVRSESGNKSVTTSQAIYRYPKSASPIADTIGLPGKAIGFGTICPPEWCAWYIAAKKKQEVLIADNLERMSDFIGTIDNKYDAYLWLMSHTLAESRGIPITTTPAIRYKAVKNGYLIRLNLRISDCFITYADVTYFVGRNKKVVQVRSVITSVSQSCI